MNRIAPPVVVVSDGGCGFEKARKKAWPNTRVQRCTFDVFGIVKQATTTRPKLACSREFYQIGTRLFHVKDREQATVWVQDCMAWCVRWEDFLAEKTPTPDGGWEYRHERLVRARNSVNRLLGQGGVVHLHRPSVRGGAAGDEQPDRRGLECAFAADAARPSWHAAEPADQSDLLVVLHAHRTSPACSQDLQGHAHRRPDRRRLAPRLTRTRRRRDYPRWGDAICWHELHHTSPHRNDWD